MQIPDDTVREFAAKEQSSKHFWRMELQVQKEEILLLLARQDSAEEKWKQELTQTEEEEEENAVVVGEKKVQVGSATHNEEDGAAGDDENGYLISQRSKHFRAEKLQKQVEGYWLQLEREANRSQETWHVFDVEIQVQSVVEVDVVVDVKEAAALLQAVSFEL